MRARTLRGSTAKWLVRKVRPLPDGTGDHDRARQAMGNTNTTDITLLPGIPWLVPALASSRRAPQL
jgi:hypothetical protein